MSTTTPGSPTLHTNQDSRSEDPTGTKTLRKRQAQHFSGRWQTVRGILRETLEENDALRLRDIGHGPETSNIPGTLRPQAIDDFGAESNADRLSRFSEWFRNVLETHVLEPTSEDQAKEGRHYTSTIIEKSYSRGLALSNIDLRQSSLPDPDTGEEGTENPSDLIGRDRHQDALKQARGLIYGDVDRAVNETHTAANRTLAENLGYVTAGTVTNAAGDGLSIKELTKRVIDRVTSIGQNRTTMAVHTRVVESVNNALLQRGVETGVGEVGVEAEADAPEYEHTTAGDRRVCDECSSLEGQRYTITELQTGAANKPPIHVRCRCRIVLLI